MNEKIEKITQILSKTWDFDEDIKQDVFIKIVEKIKLDDYADETLLSLVRKMLKNEMIDQKRKQRMNYIDADASEIDFLTFLADEEWFDIDDKEIMLRRALKSLDQKEQEIFEMVLQGKKNSEISSQLKITENTIKSIRKRAVQKLKKIML
jgi:RNA polymerase sigma factor (sigma-70 family)